MIQGGDHSAGGFTIVETLIVLAVTGVLFISAAVLINGRQNKTQFQTAINNLQQQIQQISNETASGYFPNSGNFTCNGSTGSAPSLSNGAAAQGTNGSCIFLGKVLQFQVHDQPDQFLTYAIAGNRQVNTGGTIREVQSLAEAYPVAIAGGNSGATNSGLTGITLNTPLENGLSVASLKLIKNDSPTDIGAFGFINSLASYSGCSGDLCSGSQKLVLYGIAGTSLDQGSAAAVAAIDAAAGSAFKPADSIQLCMASGSTDQSGLITIGGGDSAAAVSLQIHDGVTCS